MFGSMGSMGSVNSIGTLFVGSVGTVRGMAMSGAHLCSSVPLPI